MSPFHFSSLYFSLFSVLQTYFLSLSVQLKPLIFIKNLTYSSIFMAIVYFNLTGALPFYWAFTSYFWGNFVITLLICLSCTILSCVKNIKTLLSSFLPRNCPKALWVFLVYLELLSQLMRPLTLALRLACNLMTGHVLTHLLMPKFFVTLCFILMFETMISLIQAKVFSLLSLMYVSENS